MTKQSARKKEPTTPKASNPLFAGQIGVSDWGLIVFGQAAVGGSLGWLIEDSLDPWSDSVNDNGISRHTWKSLYIQYRRLNEPCQQRWLASHNFSSMLARLWHPSNHNFNVMTSRWLGSFWSAPAVLSFLVFASILQTEHWSSLSHPGVNLELGWWCWKINKPPPVSSVAIAIADVFRKNAISVGRKFAKMLKIFDKIDRIKSRRVI